MENEVFCVDCKDFVILSIFTKYHKRHEMKLMGDLLEDRKKECYSLLESRRQNNNADMACFEENDKKWRAMKAQAASMQESLNHRSRIITNQIELNTLKGCDAIDAELSKIERNYWHFKNTFIDSENNKLLSLEKTIEHLDGMSMRKFSLILPDLPKTTPAYNLQLTLAFQAAPQRVIHSQHLPKIVPSRVLTIIIYYILIIYQLLYNCHVFHDGCNSLQNDLAKIIKNSQ